MAMTDNGDIQGCVLTEESSYTVGTNIEIGADLGLNLGAVLSLGVSASVWTSTETGHAQGGQKQRPAGAWACALVITPNVLTVKGTVIDTFDEDDNCKPGEPTPYVVDDPLKKDELRASCALNLAFIDADVDHDGRMSTRILYYSLPFVMGQR
ncbi:MAG: hypothetical protein Q9217_006067 [Psora testacea]